MTHINIITGFWNIIPNPSLQNTFLQKMKNETK